MSLSGLVSAQAWGADYSQPGGVGKGRGVGPLLVPGVSCALLLMMVGFPALAQELDEMCKWQWRSLKTRRVRG